MTPHHRRSFAPVHNILYGDKPAELNWGFNSNALIPKTLDLWTPANSLSRRSVDKRGGTWPDILELNDARRSGDRRRLRRSDAARCRQAPSISSSPTRPTTSSSKANCAAPTTPRSTPSTTIGTSSSSFADYDRFTRDWLTAARHVLKDTGGALGHRLLSQHLPRRRDPAGPGLLDPERRRLAQDQPDAELPGQALHQRA